jgi:transposase InsO family protein
MSKARVAVLHVVSGQLSVTAAAKTYGLSRQHLHRLLKRYREGGLEAVDPRSRRPASNPRAVSDDVIIAIVGLREQLSGDGLDAGPLTLQWHLHQAGLPVPSTSTIRRILHHHGLITAQPRKRPRSSYHRFEAAQPNQCWQSDFTHWQLADGSEVEILNWLDDHSRYLLACTAYPRVAGPDVVASFIDTANTHGLPASTLTDNGSVYTARFTHGHNEFELLLANLGIIQKNGHPGHPQTQGKIERFHQTLKRWLAQRPRPATLPDMQALLDTFRSLYNTERAHRALRPHTTPAQALHRTTQSRPTRHRAHRALPHPPRHRRCLRQTHPAIRQPPAPPRHRHHPCRRQSPHPRHRHHRHRPGHTQLPTHRQPPHRPRPQLLAQPTKTPRPMAGAICNR